MATRPSLVPRDRAASRGFGLIEMLVAITLLAVGALAAASMQRTAVRANQTATTRQAAASLARQLLETSRVLWYFDPCLNSTTGGFVDPDASRCGTRVTPANPLNAQGTASGGRIFTRRWIIDTPSADVKRIQVRVTWMQNERSQQITLATLKVR